MYLFADDPLATLATNIITTPSSGTQETWSVSIPTPSNGQIWPTILSGQSIKCTVGSEIVEVIYPSTTTAGTQSWTVLRAMEGTSATTHSTGTPINLDLTAGLVRSFRQYVNVLNFGAKGDGITDDTAALQAALTAAGSGDLYLPTGTYLFGTGWTSSTLFSMTNNYSRIIGDGIGRTILLLANSLAVGDNGINFAIQHGLQQRIEGITFECGTGYTDGTGHGSASLNGADLYSDSTYGQINDCEFVNFWGINTAGGAPISTYRPYNRVDVNTTLGTTIATTGSHTCTPPSMLGIYEGRYLRINDGGGSAEWVFVSATTSTTFTATFANTHASTETCQGWGNSEQYGLIQRNFIHDCYQSCGMVINSAAITIQDNVIFNVGSSGTQHGIYYQGGRGLIQGNTIKGVSGYGIQGYFDVNYEDASGNRIADNFIEDWNNIQGSGLTPAIYVDNNGLTNTSGTNPMLPSGASLQRQTTISGNHCRLNKGLATSTTGGYAGILAMSSTGNAGVVATGNIIEDVQWGYGIRINAPYSSAVGNQINFVNATKGQTAIQVDGLGSSAIGNTVVNCPASGFSAQIVEGNYMSLSASASAGSTIGGSIIRNNIFDFSANTTGTQPGIALIAGSNAEFEFCGNQIIPANSNGGGNYILRLNSAYYTRGKICDNWVPQGTALYHGFDIRTNDSPGTGRITVSGNENIPLTSNDSGGGATLPSIPLKQEMGKLLQGVKDASALADIGYLMKLNSSGQVTLCATTDVSFFGANASVDWGTHVMDCYLQGYAVGMEAWLQVDGSWTAGHVGTISTSSAAKIHDTGGTAIPQSVAYVTFVDTHTGAGIAHCIIGSLGANGGVTMTAQTASYTLVLTDANTVVEMNSGSALNLTVPPNSSVAFPIGTVIEVTQMGVGQVTLVPGSGVTLDTPASLLIRHQYSTVGLRKRATDVWIVSGDLQ